MEKRKNILIFFVSYKITKKKLCSPSLAISRIGLPACKEENQRLDIGYFHKTQKSIVGKIAKGKNPLLKFA